MPGRIGVEVNLGAAGDTRDTLLRRSKTVRILVLGDFSGRRNRGLEKAADLASRPILEVDVDSFGAVFRRLSPCLALGPGDDGTSALTARFDTLDDFHPDRLFATLEPFRKLRESRSRLLDPASFEQEASRLMECQPLPASVAKAGSAAELIQAEGQAEMLTRLIGGPADAALRRMPVIGFVDELIGRLVQPHIEPGSTRAPDPYIAALDASTTDLMRTLLHQADFQALESTWRGVRRLVESLDLGSELKLYVVDVSKGELLADCAASRGNPQDSAAYRLIVEANRGADPQPWSLLVGHCRFGADADDIALLGHLGVIASHAGGPLLAEADPNLVGCAALNERAEPRNWTFVGSDVDERWLALRRSPVARWLGLAMPRVLLRLPYGTKTDRVEEFSFEEFAATANHESYLWGNPALACAQVIARAFLENDRETSDEGSHEIDDLPAHVRDQDGERHLQACAEFLLPLRVGDEMLRRGMIPVLSYGNRNAVRLMRLQSISEPLAALAGFD